MDSGCSILDYILEGLSACLAKVHVYGVLVLTLMYGVERRAEYEYETVSCLLNLKFDTTIWG